MGNSVAQSLKPEELSEFRKLNTTAVETLDIPARPENRVATDKKFLVVFGIAILLLIPLLAYTLIYADLKRFVIGIDQCGNLCGYQNKKWDGISCSGEDMTSRPYLQYDRNIQDVNDTDLISRRCVEHCDSSYVKSGYTCYPGHGGGGYRSGSDDVTYKSTNDLNFDEVHYKWWKLIIVLIITVILCVVLMFLLRFSTAVVVWTCIAVCVLVSLLVTGLLWYFYLKNKDLIVPAIAMSVFTLIVLLIIGVLFRKIRLVILLLKETVKAIFSMPAILFVPLLVMFCELIIMILFGVLSALILSSGKLREIEGHSGYYHYDGGVMVTITFAYNAIIAFWVTQFVVGCHYVVIGGAISKWYFAKNKQYLDSPIWTATTNLFRFHLGSVAFGSLIVTIIEIIRQLLKALAEKDSAKWVVDCIMDCIGAIIKFFTKNAYIMTGIHGQSFYKSGKRAAKLLINNIVNLAVVSSVTDWVLAIAQGLLVLVATTIAFFIYNQDPVATFLTFILIVIIVILTFAVFSVTNDTLFLCFCEDSNINDGMSRPYCMTKGLMEFIDYSKQVYGEKKQNHF